MGLGLGIKPKLFRLIGGGQIDARPAQVSGNPERVLGYMAELAGPINTVIDVGASTGIWSERVRPLWPLASYLMIEAQEVHYPDLDAYRAGSPRRFVERAAASDHDGEIHFLTENPWGGSASQTAFATADKELPCVTVDTAVAKRQLDGPYLLKLDTHGHEREILAGASETLENAALLVIEAYNFANFDRMTFWELCERMGDYGFRPAGLFDPMTRPFDNLLWQMDLCFLPAAHPCFTDTGYGG